MNPRDMSGYVIDYKVMGAVGWGGRVLHNAQITKQSRMRIPISRMIGHRNVTISHLASRL